MVWGGGEAAANRVGVRGGWGRGGGRGVGVGWGFLGGGGVVWTGGVGGGGGGVGERGEGEGWDGGVWWGLGGGGGITAIYHKQWSSQWPGLSLMLNLMAPNIASFWRGGGGFFVLIFVWVCFLLF